MKKTQFEHGQIIIIIVLAMVAILGVTALAVDGSMVYNSKRSAQSSADSAALAGAGGVAQYLKTANMSGFSCGGTVSANAATAGMNTAITTAGKDGYSLTANDMTTNGVTTQCDTYNGRKYIDVIVKITTTTQPRFIQFVHSGPITTSAEATARVYISTSFASGNLIYTTGTACSYSKSPYGGIHVTGNGNITVSNGGIFSNSCLETTGSSDIYVYDGVAQYMGVGSKSFYSGSIKQTTGSNGLIMGTNTTSFILNDIDTSSGNSISDYITQSYQMWSTPSANGNIPEAFWPSPTTQVITAELEDITLPVCPSTPGTFTSGPSGSGSDTTLYPGTYTSSSAFQFGGWGNYTLLFKPGVYCFNNSLSIGSGPEIVTMKDVVIYFTGNGGISFGGTVTPTLDGSSIFITNGDFSVASGLTFNADNFFVYIANGGFSITGAAKGTLSSFRASNSVYAIPGVLVYMGNSNSSNVEINGSAGLQAYGTIFAPNSLVKVSGASTSNTMDVQIIGKAVWVAGSGTITMDSDGATLYSQGSTTIQLMK